MKFELDEGDINQIIAALDMRRADAEKQKRRADQRGFRPAAGKIDVNSAKLAAVNLALMKIKAQMRNQERKGQ